MRAAGPPAVIAVLAAVWSIAADLMPASPVTGGVVYHAAHRAARLPRPLPTAATR